MLKIKAAGCHKLQKMYLKCKKKKFSLYLIVYDASSTTNLKIIFIITITK